MLLNQFPSNPEFLYHYSTSAGLLGIVNYGQLWLSNVDFLNDAQEYSYGLNLIEEVMRDNYAPLFRVEVGRGLVSPIFSMSLTEREDLLSQWRGYCPNGGYSFAFDKQQLNAMLSAENVKWPWSLLKVGKCIYKEDEQVEYIKQRLAALIPSPDRQQYYLAWQQSLELRGQLRPLVHKRYTEPLTEEEERTFEQLKAELNELETKHGSLPDARSPGRDLMHGQDDLRRSIPEIATLLKNPTFEEEQEWRIIYRYNELFNIGSRNPLIDEGVEFREGRSTLIPYIKVSLAAAGERVHITKVFVSPGPQQELAKIACEAFLRRNGSADAIVENSKIPYRNW